MNKAQNGKYDNVANRFWENAEFMISKRNISWKELAGALGIDPRTLSSKKASKTNISLGSAAEIADAIGTSVDRLIYGRPEESY